MSVHESKNMAEKIDDLKQLGVVTEVKVVKGSEAYNEAILAEPPRAGHPRTWLLIGCLLLGCFCQTMNGYDGSLFGGLTANQNFLDFFHGTNDGTWAALNSAMYQIGSVCALPFVGPAIDTWGRKVGMLIGAWLIILGTILNGTTLEHGGDWQGALSQLKGGRFILGFGVNIVSAAGPVYVVETAHPSWRGVITAYCNTFWFTGSILSAGAVRGALDLGGNASWQVPVWLQLLFPSMIALGAWAIPESPRWLFVNNKREKAIAVLTKWHGYDNRESAWVRLQISEYEEFLNLNGADKRFWDYSALFKTRASRYRIAVNCTFSIFAQWAGNGVLTYFLPAVLERAGYESGVTQANINLGYACFQFAFALFGAAFVDRIGRRPMMLFSMGGCTIVWIGMTVASAIFNESGESNRSAASATLAMIFLFGGVYSVGLTPLQALYPVEVLSFEMRAKGMAFSGFAVAVGGMLNQFAWPISLEKIGWKTYIVFVVWDAVMFTVFYFFMPETKKRTLEELDLVFEQPNPVKASLIPHRIAMGSDGRIIASEDA